MEPIEGRAASVLLHRYRDDAEVHAARCADEPAEAGDDAGRRAWRQLLAALDELRRTRPEAGGTRHRRRLDVSHPWIAPPQARSTARI